VKIVLEQQKEAVKEQLDRYCESILQTYEQAINTYLDQFNAGFRIERNRRRLHDGNPNLCLFDGRNHIQSSLLY